MQKFPTRSLIIVGLLISVTSVLANLLFFALTQALGEKYILPLNENPVQSEPMPILMVILATAIPAILATFLFGFLHKVTPLSVLPTFLSICFTALLISFGGPLDLPGTGIQTKILLSSMHVIAAIIIIGGLIIFHSRNKITTETENQ